jgi:WAS/WASL-interacting protein
VNVQAKSADAPSAKPETVPASTMPAAPPVPSAPPPLPSAEPPAPTATPPEPLNTPNS